MKDNRYLDIKTIYISDLSVAEYMLKLFFKEITPPLFEKSFTRIREMDDKINNLLSNISNIDVESYINLFNKEFESSGILRKVVFAFESKSFVNEPLRLFLNSYTEGEPLKIEDFSLASNYFVDLDKKIFIISS